MRVRNLTPKVQGFLRKVNPRRVSRAPKARATAVADGNGVNIPQPAVRDEVLRWSSLIGLGWRPMGFQETAPATQTVPETDTGGLVEYTEALERTVLKELGKMPP